MKKFIIGVFALVMAMSLGAETASGKILFVYDEVNDSSSPFIADFREAFADKGISFDEAAAADMKAKDLSAYDTIVVYGMVQAFASKSPVRDWLKTGVDLGGKEVFLFVTANRWFLKKLTGQLSSLLKKDKAEIVDAVSMATRDADYSAKTNAVRQQVARLK
jgi:hypothetical protein